MKTAATKRPSFLRNLIMTVRADEPNPTPNPKNTDPKPDNTDPAPTPPKQNEDPKPSGTLNFEDLVAKARSEERAKLYPDIAKHKERANNFLVVIQERDNTIKELTAKVSELESKLEKSGSKGSSAKESELQATISNLEQQLEMAKATYEKELSLKEVEIYRTQKLAEVGDQIIPELVTGYTQEEIDASIELSKTRFQEIRERMMGSVTYPSANLPNAASTLKIDKTPEEISRMNAKEYAEYRKTVGLK